MTYNAKKIVIIWLPWFWVVGISCPGSIKPGADIDHKIEVVRALVTLVLGRIEWSKRRTSVQVWCSVLN